MVQENLRSRFRSSTDREFDSAFQELKLHELLRQEGCEIEFHPAVTATTKTPDFKVKQPDGSEFLLEACTSAKVSSGPEKNPRAGRIRDFLVNLDLGGY